MFGLADWVLDRFVTRRVQLHRLQYEATRLRERSVLSSVVLVLVANGLVFWSLLNAVLGGRLDLGGLVVFAQAAISASMIAFGGLNWASDGAAAPVAAVLRLGTRTGPAGALAERKPAGGQPSGRRDPVPPGDVQLSGHRPTGPARTLTSPSRPVRPWRSSGATAPARPPWPSCCAGSTIRTPARSRSTGWTCASWTSTRGGHGWRRCSRTSSGFEWPLRDNVAPRGAPGRRHRRRAAGSRRRRPGRPGHRAGQGLSGRHRPVRRTVATDRAGPRAVRGPARRGRGPARRTHRPARRTGGGRDLRADPRRRPALHHHPRSRTGSPPSAGPTASACWKTEPWSSSATHDELMAADGRYRTMFDLPGPALRRGPERGHRGRRSQRMTSSPETRRSRSSTSCHRRWSSMWRLLQAGFPLRAAADGRGSGPVAAVGALPDALLALWLKLLADGVLRGTTDRSTWPAPGLGAVRRGDLVPRAALSARIQRRFRDRGDHRSRSRTWRGCRRRWPRSRTTNDPTIWTGWPCCGNRSSCSTTCTCRCSPPSAGSCGWSSSSAC